MESLLSFPEAIGIETAGPSREVLTTEEEKLDDLVLYLLGLKPNSEKLVRYQELPLFAI